MLFAPVLYLVVICAVVREGNALRSSDIVDTSSWVGAEYQPMQSTNEDWLYHYDDYESSIEREFQLIKKALQFKTLRVFLHSLIYETNSTLLLKNMDRFLTLADKYNFNIGFVFFDDCWNHEGMDLSSPCEPVKGVHNGCWMASPQDNDRTSIDRYYAYVTDIVSHFLMDPRIVWWEVFNEPNDSSFSMSLRSAAYQWITELNPAAPILSCWDENNATDLVDHHQYTLPWNGVDNDVFLNSSSRMRGGVVTEAGARWYQGYASDAGNPLTVIDWLTKLRVSDAPFVPGVMIDWEVMVSNSNTRWHWDTPPNSPEPAIPWHQHLFPDGTPVSFTEAAAIRRYITGIDDFVFVDDFLNSKSNPNSDEIYFVLSASDLYQVPVDMTNNVLEMTLLFPESSSSSSAEIRFRESSLGHYSVTIHADELTLTLTKTIHFNNISHSSVLSSFDITSLDCSLIRNGWNMIRIYANHDDIAVYLNPMFVDVFPETLPMPGQPPVPIRAMPPRIAVTDTKALRSGSVSVIAGEAEIFMDYISLLPPELYGADFSM